MEEAYRGVMGGYAVLKDGDTRHSPTHAVIDLDEYYELVDDIKSLRQQIESQKAQHMIELEKVKQEAVAYKRQADIGAQQAKVIAESRARNAEREAERQRNLNRNLLRIAKERANAKRGLRPKGRHCGYRFSGKIAQTKTISGHDKKTGAIYTDVWTATLETPYDGTIPINQIRDRIFDDLVGEGGLLQKLYVDYVADDSESIWGTVIPWKGTYAEAMRYNQDGTRNLLFDYKFMVNPRSGLWEVQITTTKSIRAISELMGPRKNVPAPTDKPEERSVVKYYLD